MKLAFLIVSSFFVAFIRLDPTLAQNGSKEKCAAHSSRRLGEIFAKTKTICVGRYLVDVPENAIVVYGPANVPYRTTRFPKKASAFNQMVEQYAKDALSKKSKLPIGPASGPNSIVGKVAQGFGENNKIVYGVDEMTGAFYDIQSLVIVGDDVYIQEHSYYGESDRLDKVVEELKSAAANIIPRTTEGAPPAAGVCIDGAFVLDRVPPHHEQTTVGVRLAEFNDVHFAIEMTLKDRLIESDALEPRLKSGEESAKAEGRGEWYSRIKFLRRSERQISNWRGFEALARRPRQGKFSSFHEFEFVSQGEPNNPMLPVIDLELYTGVQDNTVGLNVPSLNDAEAVELWDKLTNSIRPINSIAK